MPGLASMELLERLPAAPGFHRPNGLADLTLRSAVRRHIVLVLEYAGGHQRWAAAELEIDPSTLYRILQEWEGRRPKMPKARRRDELAGFGDGR